MGYVEIRKIEPGEIDAVLEVFANNFFDDRYYQGWYKDKKEMMDDFREVMTWTLENGWNMGAYDGGNLVGMALTFPLRKLDDHMFGEFFGELEYCPSGSPDGLFGRGLYLRQCTGLRRGFRQFRNRPSREKCPRPCRSIPGFLSVPERQPAVHGTIHGQL